MTFGTEYDAGLHLLDRQIVGSDDALVAKVDDVELSIDPDGSLVATAILVGLPALLPRFGGRFGDALLRRYTEVGDTYADRVRPSVIEVDMIDSVGSEVRLLVPGTGLLRARVDDALPVLDRWRLGGLIGMPVVCADLPKASLVLDARLTRPPESPDRLRVSSLIVGPGRPGALLGYDRRHEPGPLVVAAVIRWLHRHARVVELGHGVEIDRAGGRVRIGPQASLRPLLD